MVPPMRAVYVYYSVLRAIPLKNQKGGRKISLTPSDKIRIFQPPGQKRVFSLPPSDTKQDFFTLLGHVLFLWPPRQFCPILPPSDSFSCRFYPLGQFFVNLPPRTAFFTHFTPLGHFFNNFTPLGHFFLRPLSDKNCIFLPPRSKTRIFSTPFGHGNLTPSDKKAISSPPSIFFNGIALSSFNINFVHLHDCEIYPEQWIFHCS